MAPLADYTNIVDQQQQDDDDTQQHQVQSSTQTHRPNGKPPRPTKTKQRHDQSLKHVSFSDYSEMWVVESCLSFSDDEISSYYMNEDDYIRIGKEINETISIMEKGNYPGTSSKYFRGLEAHLKHAKAQRKQRIAFVVATVLQEQEKRGTLHQEWVNHYLCVLTVPFTQAAHIMGIFDFQSQFADFSSEATGTQQQQHYCHGTSSVPSPPSDRCRKQRAPVVLTTGRRVPQKHTA